MTPTFQSLTQWSLWLAGVFAVVCALYLLKPRRRTVTVPFGSLWQRALNRAEARRFGSRWRRLWSMLWTLMMAACLMTALGDEPLGLHTWTQPPERKPRSVVLLVDTSASMGTLDRWSPGDAPQSRLKVAVETLVETLRRGDDGAEYLVLSASSSVRTMGPWTADRDSLSQSLRALSSKSGGLHVARAWSAALSALEGRPSPSVVWVTDGGHQLPKAPSGVDTFELQVGQASAVKGRTIWNLSIERMTVRVRADQPGRGAVSVKVRNDSERPLQAVITLFESDDAQSSSDFLVENRSIGVHTLVIQAGSSQWLELRDVELNASRYASRVSFPPGSGASDVAPWDDWGFAVTRAQRRLKVWLVGQSDMFLDAALLANERFSVERVQVKDLNRERIAAAIKAGAKPDVVLANEVEVPPTLSIPWLQMGLDVSPGTPSDAPGDLIMRRRDHPVIAGLSLHDVNIDRLRGLPSTAGDTVLITQRQGAAVLTAHEGPPRRLRLGLNLRETDLGGRYALPLFMSNAVEWLVSDDQWLQTSLVVGTPWSIAAPQSTDRWTWSPPSKRTRRARVAEGQLGGVSEEHGIHVWRSAQGQQVERGTRLPDSERPHVSQTQLPPWRPHQAQDELRKTASSRLPVWWWLVLATGLMLLVEWRLFYLRRIA